MTGLSSSKEQRQKSHCSRKRNREEGSDGAGLPNTGFSFSCVPDFHLPYVHHILMETLCHCCLVFSAGNSSRSKKEHWRRPPCLAATSKAAQHSTAQHTQPSNSLAACISGLRNAELTVVNGLERGWESLCQLRGAQ